MVRTCGVLYILTSKCASRHNGVHFFNISTSKSGPTLRCFVHFDFEMCFAPQRRALFHLSSGQLAPHRRFSEPTFPRSLKSLEKHSVSRLSYLFAHLHLLSSDSFSSLLLSSNLSLLSASALLCFSSVHIVGSLTSKLPSAKLPSIIIIVIIIISPQLCGFLVFDSVSRASSASSASSHQLCHTPSFTHNNFTHHLSTTIFHTITSHTHNFVTHHLSTTIFHTQ